MASSFSTLQAGAPRPALALDHEAVLNYMRAAGVLEPHTSELRVLAFSHGQSNPTYMLEARESGGGLRRLVLRKQPPGTLLQKAHDVGREAAVQRALRTQGIPVPRVLSSCDDPSVLGTRFYIMEFVEGRIFTDPRLPEVRGGGGGRAAARLGRRRGCRREGELSASLLVYYAREQRLS